MGLFLCVWVMENTLIYSRKYISIDECIRSICMQMYYVLFVDENFCCVKVFGSSISLTDFVCKTNKQTNKNFRQNPVQNYFFTNANAALSQDMVLQNGMQRFCVKLSLKSKLISTCFLHKLSHSEILRAK